MSMSILLRLYALYTSFFLLVCFSQVHCINWTNEVNISICNWSQLRANIIRDTIYLDGGNLWWQFGLSDGTYGAPFGNNENGAYMYNLNLSQYFDEQTNMTGALQAMAKNGSTSSASVNPNYEDGTMFANDNEFILYGGMSQLTGSNSPPPAEAILGYEAYEYPIKTQGWKPRFSQKSTDNGVTRYITNGAGVSAPSENLGFYFSGMRAPDGGLIEGDDGSANTAATSLITVNMTTMGAENWQNSSLPADITGRANAELVWLPVSESGVLVVIGGVVNPEILTPGRNLTSAQAEASSQISPTFMTELSIYDVASQTWYLQNTTGEYPPQLTMFCSVVASASDNSSHNIYIYGGYDGINAASTPSDDVYILSVPSFVWAKAYSGQSFHGRSGHKCLKVYPDKMFVLGGIFKNDPSVCLDGSFVQVFNLNTLQFQSSYDPRNWSNYSVPSVVINQIGGDMNGGATITSPKSWNNGNLRNIFTRPYSKSISTYYPYASATGLSAQSLSPTATAGESSAASNQSLSEVRIILAASICLGVICIVLFVWIFTRRSAHRRSTKAAKRSGTTRDDTTQDARPPRDELKSQHIKNSTTKSSQREADLSIPQIQKPKQARLKTTGSSIKSAKTQADRYPIFELDTRPDKCVELPSDGREIRRKLTSIGRNFRNLKISPHAARRIKPRVQTGSLSIQSTPTEFQGESPRETISIEMADFEINEEIESPILGYARSLARSRAIRELE